jgi:DNA-binding CsgD family transcriptional regulator
MVRRKVARQWRRLQRQERFDNQPGEGQNLTDSERQILDLRRQGYTTAEIAERVGLSGVALRVRLTRLKQRLQQIGAFDDWI